MRNPVCYKLIFAGMFLVLSTVPARSAGGDISKNETIGQWTPPAMGQASPSSPFDKPAMPPLALPPPPSSPPAPDRHGAYNPQTGEQYLPSGQGVINPRTGEYYPRSGNGYMNPRTGQFYPRINPDSH
jgi:hypothetical protein